MRDKNPWTVRAIIERIQNERRQAALDERRAGTGRSLWDELWSCQADPGELTVAQAHTAMQIHLACGVDRCRVRARGREALVTGGRMVLEARATRATGRTLPDRARDAVFGWGAMLLGGRHAL